MEFRVVDPLSLERRASDIVVFSELFIFVICEFAIHDFESLEEFILGISVVIVVEEKKVSDLIFCSEPPGGPEVIEGAGNAEEDGESCKIGVSREVEYGEVRCEIGGVPGQVDGGESNCESIGLSIVLVILEEGENLGFFFGEAFLDERLLFMVFEEIERVESEEPFNQVGDLRH